MFLLNVVKLKSPEPRLVLEAKVSAVKSTLDAARITSDAFHELVKTFAKARCLRLAWQFLQLRVAHQGWHQRNVQLAVRVCFAFIYLK
jgi:hypothetical protein